MEHADALSYSMEELAAVVRAGVGLVVKSMIEMIS
jgi:hypothetical protein